MMRGAHVGTLMTPTPVCCDPYELLIVARDRMAQHKVRHLAVVDAEKLVGVVSARDIDALKRCPYTPLARATVADAMEPHVFAVAPTTPVGDVAATMAAKRYGSAIVVDKVGAPLGIFTTVDALRAVITLLHVRGRVEVSNGRGSQSAARRGGPLARKRS
jgi:acetoin utilization protein AcuB